MLVRLALAALLLAAGAAQAGAADVMERVRASGEIRLGYRADAPPFSYADDAGAPAGLAVALCARAAEAVRAALGLEALSVRHVVVTGANRFEALEEERIDLLCGPTTQTLSRRGTMDFSIPYFIDGASAVFRAGKGAEIGALSGRAAGVLAGTTTEALLPGLLAARGAEGAETVSYRTHVEGLEALAAGEIAAYFGDQAILRYQLGRLRPAAPLQFADEQFSFEPYALAMRRGETALRLEVDRALSHAFETGAIHGMIDASLGEVMLSDVTRAVFEVVTLPD